MPTSLTDLFNDYTPTGEELDLAEEIAQMPTVRQGPSGYPYSMFPGGSNKLPLISNFMERRRYKHGTYFRDLPSPIDLYYDKNYYGRVDRFQNAVVPKADNSLYKQVAQENVFAFDFAADAFFKLRRNMKIATDSGAIEKVITNLGDLTAVGGWSNWKDRYRSQMEVLHTNFVRHISQLEGRKYKKILTFKDYIEEFKNYVRAAKYQAPITLTGMVLHKSYDARYTGMMLQITREDCGDDARKYNKYLADINFPYYVRAARKFGFYVDKNAPWRLYTDIFSPPMLDTSNGKGFLAHYGVNKQTFFNTYYERTYMLDMVYLVGYFVDSYNRFVAASPVVIDTLPPTLKCPEPRLNMEYRFAIEGPEIGQRPGEQPWTLGNAIAERDLYEFYFFLRSFESGVQYKNEKYLIRRALDIAMVYGPPRAVLYIHNLFKPYIYTNSLLQTFPLTRASAPVTIGSIGARSS